MKKTTMKISEEVKEELGKAKLVPEESYNSVVERLLKLWKDQNLQGEDL